MIRKALSLLLAGILAPLAVARAQTREPLKCVDPEGKATLTESEVHRPPEAAVQRPALLHAKNALVGGKTLLPSHPLLFETLIDKEGRVCAARLLAGDEAEETRSWLEAIRQWRFRPAALDGQSVGFYMVQTVSPAEKVRPAQTSPRHIVRSTVGAAITPGLVTVGNQTLPLPASHAQIVSILGSPSRVSASPGSPNRILVWDSLGLVAYESQETGTVSSIAFYFRPLPDREFSPGTLARSLSLGGTKVDASSTLEAVGTEILRQGGKHVRRLAFGVWILQYGMFDLAIEQLDSATIQTVSVDVHR